MAMAKRRRCEFYFSFVAVILRARARCATRAGCLCAAVIRHECAARRWWYMLEILSDIVSLRYTPPYVVAAADMSRDAWFCCDITLLLAILLYCLLLLFTLPYERWRHACRQVICLFACCHIAIRHYYLSPSPFQRWAKFRASYCYVCYVCYVLCSIIIIIIFIFRY